jgi:two-component system, OmpR family, sensor histidine kinase KdpD
MSTLKSSFQFDAAAKYGFAILLWWIALTLIFFLDGEVDIRSLAMVLIVASALTGLLLPPTIAVIGCALAVGGFDWFFVPPKGSFSVALEQHFFLIAATLAVSMFIAGLTSRLRNVAANEKRRRLKAEQLASLVIALSRTDDPADQLQLLETSISAWTNAPVICMALPGTNPSTNDANACHVTAPVSPKELDALWQTLRQNTKMGLGTHTHDELMDLYLPMQGRFEGFGSVLIRSPNVNNISKKQILKRTMSHAQTLCNQMGLAIERNISVSK